MSGDDLQRGEHHLHGLPRVPAFAEKPLDVEGDGALLRRCQHGDDNIAECDVVEACNRSVELRFRSLSPLSSDLVATVRAGGHDVPRFHERSMTCVGQKRQRRATSRAEASPKEWGTVPVYSLWSAAGAPGAVAPTLGTEPTSARVGSRVMAR